MDNEKAMFSVKEISQIMGIGRDKAYDLLHSKQFPVIKVGRRLLVHKDVLVAWMKGEKV